MTVRLGHGSNLKNLNCARIRHKQITVVLKEGIEAKYPLVANWHKYAPSPVNLQVNLGRKKEHLSITSRSSSTRMCGKLGYTTKFATSFYLPDAYRCYGKPWNRK